MQRTLTPRCHQQGTGVKEQELISQAGIQVAPAGAVPCLYDLVFSSFTDGSIGPHLAFNAGVTMLRGS